MGGFGGLKLAFRNPEYFAAVAALEPGIDAALEPSDNTDRNFISCMFDTGDLEDSQPRLDLAGMWGGDTPTTYDVAHYKQQNPASVVDENAKIIRDSGLKIFIEAGDQDCLNLHEGTEFLHRVLWNHGIEHEYRLIHGADHIGSSLTGRMQDAETWLHKTMKNILNPPDPEVNALDEEEKKFVEWMWKGAAEGEEMVGTPVDPLSDKMIVALRGSFTDGMKKKFGKPNEGEANIAGYKWRSM